MASMLRTAGGAARTTGAGALTAGTAVAVVGGVPPDLGTLPPASRARGPPLPPLLGAATCRRDFPDEVLPDEPLPSPLLPSPSLSGRNLVTNPPVPSSFACRCARYALLAAKSPSSCCSFCDCPLSGSSTSSESSSNELARGPGPGLGPDAERNAVAPDDARDRDAEEPKLEAEDVLSPGLGRELGPELARPLSPPADPEAAAGA